MIRPYFPGDDVRHIDWNATARLQEPHVRVHVGERALTTWLVLDVSASMAFGTADRRKADVAEGVALAVGHVATRRGNRLGVLGFGGGDPRIMRPRQGRLGLLGAAGGAAPRESSEGAGATSLGAALAGAAALGRQRGLVVIVSDFRGERDWEAPLQRAARPPRRDGGGDRRPARAGARPGRRPVAGRPRDAAARSTSTRASDASATASRQAAAAERDEVRSALRRAGADHVVLSTAGDWLRIFAGAPAPQRGRAARRARPARAPAVQRTGSRRGASHQ